MTKILHRLVFPYYHSTGNASYDWAGKIVAEERPRRLLDVGCGDGSRLFQYLKEQPPVFCGVEGNPAQAEKARQRKIEISAYDLNGKWPYADNSFDCIHGSQIIEHIHNTRQYLAETYRTLAPGGVMVMTSENLTSLLNLGAMILGYTPFSLLTVGGWYVGNPFGLHYGDDEQAQIKGFPMEDPAFSGVAGHNRVLSVRAAEDLLRKIGFVEIDVSSIGLMPIPQWLGKPLEGLMRRRGHWLLIRARKPK